ncbi:MAG: hypothetical protein A2252_03540 [Elusimicrobia bacterium RIFOXYA2_FULL_39_19]|nr:MAG: hypothetical protein A2252_03540 [Elusimicrobia bacterium RIFOXYA2_FULL_39_19]
MKKYLGFIMLLALGSCSMYTPQTQMLPQHIKRVAIRQIVNETQYFGLEDKLTTKITDEFVRDGRLTITNEENADGAVAAKITYYSLQPLTFGANFEPQQYKLRVLLNLYFVDKVANVTLWEEPSLEGTLIYNSTTITDGKTEEEAREIVWADLAQKILTRTIQGFGSVSGISEKKVPKSAQETGTNP